MGVNARLRKEDCLDGFGRLPSPLVSFIPRLPFKSDELEVKSFIACEIAFFGSTASVSGAKSSVGTLSVVMIHNDPRRVLQIVPKRDLSSILAGYFGKCRFLTGYGC
jgi:hypothetical protein